MEWSKVEFVGLPKAAWRKRAILYLVSFFLMMMLSEWWYGDDNYGSCWCWWLWFDDEDNCGNKMYHRPSCLFWIPLRTTSLSLIKWQSFFLKITLHPSLQTFPGDSNDELFRPGRMFAVVDFFVDADDNEKVPLFCWLKGRHIR